MDDEPMSPCPGCGESVPDVAVACPQCGLLLDVGPAGPPPDPNIELTSILRTGDAALIAVVKSLLEAEGIVYMVRSERAQDLFGFGRVGAGYNILTGPADFVVRAEDAARPVADGQSAVSHRFRRNAPNPSRSALARADLRDWFLLPRDTAGFREYGGAAAGDDHDDLWHGRAHPR